MLHQSLLEDLTIGPRGLLYSPYLTLLPAMAFCAWYGASLGKNGLWATAVGTVAAIVASLNFRGSFYWPGTFSMEHTGLLNTLLPIAMGLLLGVGLSRLRRPAVEKMRKWAFGFAALAMLWTMIDSQRNLEMYTLAPYSLHYALLATYAGAVATAALVRFADQ